MKLLYEVVRPFRAPAVDLGVHLSVVEMSANEKWACSTALRSRGTEYSWRIAQEVNK